MTTNLIKNEDGSYSYGEFTVLAPVYDRTTKKHIFNILRNGYVPIRHDGNYLTLKNSIKSLTDNAVGEQPINELVEEEEHIDLTQYVTPINSDIKDPLLVALQNYLDIKTEEAYANFRELLDTELAKKVC